MRKILIAVFAVLFAAAWVAPAMAVDTTFYGTYRVRMFSTNNAADYNSSGDSKVYSGTGSTVTTTAGQNQTDNNSWTDQRFRLGVDTRASEQLRGFVQLEIGDNDNNRSNTWGSSAPEIGGRNLTVSARQAYLSFNAGPVRLKAGRQIFGDAPDGGQSFRVSDDNQYWGLLDNGLIVVAQVDGLLFGTQNNFNPWNIAGGYIKLSEASTSSTTTGASDMDNDAYALQGIIVPSDTLMAGAYFVYNRDRTTVSPAAGTGQRSPWWLGGGVRGKFDPIDLKVHLAYLGGKYEKGCQPGACGIAATGSASDLKYSGYAIDVDVSMPVGPATIGVAAGRGTGDDSSQDDKSKAFMGIAGAYGNQLGVRPAIFFDTGEVSNGGAALSTGNSNSISNTTLGNVTFAQLYAIYNVSDELKLSGLLAHFRHTENKLKTGAATSTEWDTNLGNEIDLTAVYKLYKELSITAQAAWFLPGDGIKSSKNQAGNWSGIASDDAVSEYFAKVQYDF